MYMAKKSAYSMKVKCLCEKKVGVMKFLYYLYSEKNSYARKNYFYFLEKVFAFFLKVF